MRRTPARLRIAALAALLGALPCADAVQSGSAVHFNETMVRDLRQSLAVGDPRVVFGHVFAQLAPDVTVYPTENYYYFGFFANGRAYSGNLRLSPGARREGRIHFAYFDTANPSWFRHVLLGIDDGVTVRETAALRYEVAFGGRRVTFHLNDVSQAPPSSGMLAPTERFVGRTFDESGLRFLLLYDVERRGFLWLLDDQGNPPMTLEALSPALHVDVRTQFVFYRDPQLPRWVLAGVQLAQVMDNTYFDGPFDQLPDNHLEETDFSEYVAQAYPSTRGQLNRRGESADGTSRLAVTPYAQYATVDELLALLAQCEALAQRGEVALYSCLFHDPKQQ